MCGAIRSWKDVKLSFILEMHYLEIAVHVGIDLQMEREKRKTGERGEMDSRDSRAALETFPDTYEDRLVTAFALEHGVYHI